MSLLYPHNQKAYDAALAMLSEKGKACIIHPTGTGKSFIGFQLCADFPLHRVLWLSPSEYIFKTQLENWHSAGGPDLANLSFLTYAKLTLLSPEDLGSLQPTIIILDEFHRAGAEQWGAAVKRLLTIYPPYSTKHLMKPSPNGEGGPSLATVDEVFPSAAAATTNYQLRRKASPLGPTTNSYLLGLSATNIRYLDNQRNMAEELFDNHIASEMSLSEAIVRGILSAPKYVLSVFRYQNSLTKYEARIRNTKNKAVRDEAELVFEKLRRALENSTGLPEIFEKHMPDKHGKYLVFCSNVEHMDDMIDKAPSWFASVDPSPHVYRAYSEDPSTLEAFSSFKADNSDHLKLLFCIDMLNEGIHVPDVSGVILLRPTVSPIIYKQQIGRALSAGEKKNSVIFDIVMNIENLNSISSIQEEMRSVMVYYRDLGMDDQIINESFEVVDELHDCLELFDRLNETLTASWDIMFSQAQKYHDEFGDLEVPRRYVTPEGYSLGSWLDTQRSIYQGNTVGRLTPAQIRLLDSLSMRWESHSDLSWQKYYEACKVYARQHGDLLIPRAFVSTDGLNLGQWICNLRKFHKSNIRSSFLTPERVTALENIGMQWDVPDYIFERNYASAVSYHLQHGDLEVPVKYVDENGIRLGTWISNLRTYFHSDSLTLSDDQVSRLNALGMRWLTPSELSWQRGLAEARAYVREHGTLDAPASYVSPSGFKLGVWHTRCREKYASGKLNPSQIEALESLGIVWDRSRQNPWEICFAHAEAYYREHGNLNVPPSYKVDGIWLNKWLNEQKQILLGKRPGKALSVSQQQKLASISFTVDSRSERTWKQNYNTVKSWYDSHGDTKIPPDYIDSSGKHPSLWLNRQKKAFKDGKLSESQVSQLHALQIV